MFPFSFFLLFLKLVFCVLPLLRALVGGLGILGDVEFEGMAEFLGAIGLKLGWLDIYGKFEFFITRVVRVLFFFSTTVSSMEPTSGERLGLFSWTVKI